MNNVLEKLKNSFQELEDAISGARVTLLNKLNVPDEVFERLDLYDEILLKQKEYYTELVQYVHSKNAEKISEIVKKINGLSIMLRDDAKHVVNYIINDGDKETIKYDA